jgi:uncharacterized protein YraI
MEDMMNYLKRIGVVLAIAAIELLVVFGPIGAINHLGRVGVWAQAPAGAAAASSQAQCTVAELRLNLRSGPGTQYGIIVAMPRGTAFIATERTADGAWLFGATPDNQGWTARRFLNCSAEPASLSVTTQFTQPVGVQVAATQPAAVEPAQPSTTANTEAAPPANTGSTLTLLQPLDARLFGRRSFRWQTSITLEPNQGFELVFWEAGQDPLAKGFGLVGPKTESAVDVDLDKMDLLLPQLQSGKEYAWGVLLVQIRPYRPLQYLGGGHRFLFGAPASAGGSDGGGDAAPGADPAPPPKAPPK